MELFLHYLSMPYMIQGIQVTLQVAALVLAGGLVLGVILDVPKGDLTVGPPVSVERGLRWLTA